MPWAADEWSAFCFLLARGWPGRFDEGDAGAYRTLLDGLEPERAASALRVLVGRGGHHRPTPAEIAAAAGGGDPDRPAFPEVLRAWRRAATIRPDEAALEAAERVHPYVGAFVRAQGMDHVRTFEIDDPQYGALRRAELRREWERFEQLAEEREAAGRALGEGTRRAALERFDPLRALGPGRPELPPG